MLPAGQQTEGACGTNRSRRGSGVDGRAMIKSNSKKDRGRRGAAKVLRWLREPESHFLNKSCFCNESEEIGNSPSLVPTISLVF